MELSEKEFSIQAAIEKGRKLPDWYINEPVLYPGDVFFISAYFDLSDGNPIRWIDRVRYAERKGLEPDVVEMFNHIIRELDHVHLSWNMKREKKAMALKGK